MDNIERKIKIGQFTIEAIDTGEEYALLLYKGKRLVDQKRFTFFDEVVKAYNHLVIEIKTNGLDIAKQLD